MTKQKLSLLVLISFLAVVFNLDKIGLAGGPVLSIHPAFYPTLFLAVIGTILIPALNRLPSFFYVVFWGMIFLSVRAFIFTQTPLFGGDNTFVTITELSLLILGLLLATWVAKNQKEFEKFVEKVSMPAITNPVLAGKEANDQVALEFIRSRRHNRPLSLLVVEPSSGSLNSEIKRSIEEIQRKMTQRFMVSTLAQLIGNEARRTDLIISRNDQGRFVILCPETNSDGSLRLAERIQMIAMEQLGLSMVFGISSFPDEALTYDDLLNKAEFQMQDFVPLPLSSRSVSTGKSNSPNEH